MNGYRTVNTIDRPNFESFNVGSSSDTKEVIRTNRYRLIKHKICGAVMLCMLGVVLTTVGLYWMTINRKGYVAFLSLGLLSLVPGVYGAVEIIGTLQGWAGFEQLQDPVMEDDEEGQQRRGWFGLNF